jgi:hypothetical protein
VLQTGLLPVPEAVKSTLAALVPVAGELGGTGPGERRFYGSDLWTYIDGGAEPYHGYGMVAMVPRAQLPGAGVPGII